MVGVGEGEGVDIGEGVGVAEGVGFLTTTPLFQINLLPDLTQVNFLPADIDVAPAFEHLAPAFTAAVAIGCVNTRARVTVSNTANLFRMFSLWSQLLEMPSLKDASLLRPSSEGRSN